MSKSKGLHIRKEQMKVLGEYMQRQFEARCVQRSREIGVKWYRDLEPEELLGIIRKAIKRAESYGIVSEDSVLEYLGWVFRHGFDFEHKEPLAWAAPLLADKTLREDEKLNKLDVEHIMQMKWEK